MATSLIDFLADYNVRVTDNLDAPVLTASVEGTPGTTTYTYKASFITLVGESLCSEEVSVTTGNATLNGFNKNLLTVITIPASVTYVRFWKKVSGAWYKIADVAASIGQLYDIGQATTAATVPTSNTSGRPGVIAVGLKPGQLRQRITDMDLQAIAMRRDQALWDTIFKSGNIVRGCTEIQVTGGLRQSSTEYEIGDVVTVDSSSPLRFRCIAAGTTKETDPGSWPTTVELTKVDGDSVETAVTWEAFCDWTFTEGSMYLLGTLVDVPAGTVVLTGSGTETVGVTVERLVTTSNDDVVQRAGIDELVPAADSNYGPDWVYLQVTWVVDSNGQIPIKEFVDGVPKQVTLQTQRSELEKEFARQRFDVSGNFVVSKFPLQVKNHIDDDTKLYLSVSRGKAYPNGYEVEFNGTRLLEFDKARTVKEITTSSCDDFSVTGGDVIGTVAGPFNVDGKVLKFKVGTGGYHTVTLSGLTETASDVGDQIVAAMTSDGYPGLVSYANNTANTLLQLKAKDGYSLEIALNGADEACTVLGLAVGTYEPEGSRIYQLNDYYVANVENIAYKVETVIPITRSNISDYDPVENLHEIVGISYDAVTPGNAQPECKDGKYTYTQNVNYKKSTIEGIGVCIDWSLTDPEPAGGHTYYAKVVLDYDPPLKALRQLVEVTDAQITKGAEDGSDVIVFTDATSITSVATGLDVVGPSGSAIEVVEILRVNNTAQATTQYTAYTLDTNSGAYSHEPSEINWSAAGTPGTTGTGQPSVGATYYISFRAWYHAVEGDVVHADCYDVYEEIPIYGGTYLRDCLDFRTTGVWPAHGEGIGFDYSYYLARIDKLVLDDQANLRLVTGSYAVNPTTPPDQSGVQSLAVVRVPPYTYSASDVQVVSLEVMRLTQKQIQNVADRVTRLEYWAAVNDLEKETNNKAIYGVTGGEAVAAEKQGIFTDSLTGFGRCDLQFSNETALVGGVEEAVSFTAAIDTTERCVRLGATKEKIQIAVDTDNCVNVRETGTSIMLDYQPVTIESQPYAGITVNGASDYVVTNYYGSLRITPSVDVFMDEEQLPALNVDFDNNLQPLIDAANATLVNDVAWGSWSNGEPRKTNWHSYLHNSGSVSSSTKTFDTTRTGETTTLVPGTISQDLGSRVVDLSLQGMMRAGITISCDISGLIPNSDHAVVMNGIACDLACDSTATNAAGSAGTPGHVYQTKTTAKTSNDGRLTATFTVPDGIPIGNALITVFYYADSSISSASASYYTAGFTQSNQNTVVGIPTVETATTTVTETGKVVVQGDPLAQSFKLTDNITYISEVELYFASKHSTLPFTVQIRNLVNGYPGQNILASAELFPDDIDTSTDSSTPTVFTFNNVLGYGAGDYCFVAMPGLSNTEYNLYAADVGTIDYLTNARIDTQVASGVLFHSPNGSTWEPWTKRDLKYKINKSNFENSCEIYWTGLTGKEANAFVVAVEEFIGAGTNASWAYSTDPSSVSNAAATWLPFRHSMTTDLGSVVEDVRLKIDVTSLGGNYQIVKDYAGILLLLHNENGYYIGTDEVYSDSLTYPNKITGYLDIDTDGIGASSLSVRVVTPYATIDNGLTCFEIPMKVGYTPVTAAQEPYYTYQFETADEAAITDATNASPGPIVVTSAGHGFTNGMIVTIADVEGNTNANGDWVVTNADANTFELYSAAGVAAEGNGAYSSATGTIVMKPFSQVREMIKLTTSNPALTPSVMNISFIESRV